MDLGNLSDDEKTLIAQYRTEKAARVASRAADQHDQARSIDLNDIKPGMNREDEQRVAKEIARILRESGYGG